MNGFERRGLKALAASAASTSARARHVSHASQTGQLVGIEPSAPEKEVQADVPFTHLVVAGVVIAVTAEIFLLTLNIRPRR